MREIWTIDGSAGLVKAKQAGAAVWSRPSKHHFIGGWSILRRLKGTSLTKLWAWEWQWTFQEPHIPSKRVLPGTSHGSPTFVPHPLSAGSSNFNSEKSYTATTQGQNCFTFFQKYPQNTSNTSRFSLKSWCLSSKRTDDNCRCLKESTPPTPSYPITRMEGCVPRWCCGMECKWLMPFGSRLRTFLEVSRRKFIAHANSNLHQRRIASKWSHTTPCVDHLETVVGIIYSPSFDWVCRDDCGQLGIGGVDSFRHRHSPSLLQSTMLAGCACWNVATKTTLSHKLFYPKLYLAHSHSTVAQRTTFHSKSSLDYSPRSEDRFQQSINLRALSDKASIQAWGP